MGDPSAGIDKIIQDAQQEGLFDDLEGKGKPLHLDTSPDAVIKNLLKEANVKPVWIELEAQIDRLLGEAETLLTSFDADVKRARARLLTPASPSHEAGATGAAGGARPTSSRHSWYARVVARLSLSPSAAASSSTNALIAYHRRWESRLSRYADLLHQANRLIRRLNLTVPLVHRQRVAIPVAQRLEAFTERFPCYERGPDGAPRPVQGVVPTALLTPPGEEDEDRIGKRDLQRAAALQQVRRIGRRPPPIG